MFLEGYGLIAICIIVIIIIVLIYNKKNKGRYGDGDGIFNLLIIVGLGVTVLLGLFNVYNTLFYNNIREHAEDYITYKIENIYAMSNGTFENTHGTGVIFLTVINTDTDIFFTYITDKGLGVTIKTITDDIEIREDNSETPRIVFPTAVFKNYGFHKWLIGDNSHKVEMPAIVYLPEGSVKIDYSINIGN